MKRSLILRRREALLGMACAVSLGDSALAVASSGGAADPAQGRLVVVILRGALDGMAAVVPYGDPGLAGLRGPLLLPEPGQPDGLLDLGGFYGLHPSLAGLHGLYRAGEFLPVHAVIGPTHSRSHFDAQDDLESGAAHRLESGWLNRVASLLPNAPGHPAGLALAVGSGLPLLLRGPAQTANWSPEAVQTPQPDLYARIAQLNGGDAVLGPAIAEGLRARGLTEGVLGPAGVMQPQDGHHRQAGFAALAGVAGQLLAAAEGPRIAALEIGGWDTHAAQGRRLLEPLSQLDQGMLALKAGLGAAWKRTAILVMTEFGRTVRVNGTGGTDHGTATVAFLLGGAVKGGRVGGVWPGLSTGRLFEDRDLSPTTDLRSLAKSVLRDHLGLGDSRLDVIFPGSRTVSAQGGLVI